MTLLSPGGKESDLAGRGWAREVLRYQRRDRLHGPRHSMYHMDIQSKAMKAQEDASPIEMNDQCMLVCEKSIDKAEDHRTNIIDHHQASMSTSSNNEETSNPLVMGE